MADPQESTLKPTTRLRKALAEPAITVIPGVHDGLSALLAERAGHRAVLAGGYAVTGSLLGLPDLGLITLSEMAGAVHRMAMAVNIPIIADIDTGFGEVRNVVRAVREIEAAGAAGAQIEDQVFPKQAGLTHGRRVIPARAMTDKVKAAVDARRDLDFVLVARTDARPLAEAVERANAYHEAGADVLFIEDLHSEEQMRMVNDQVRGPTLAVMVEGSGYPYLPAKRLEELGFCAVYYCMSALLACARSVAEVMTCLRETGSCESIGESMVSFEEFNRLIGFDRYLGV